MALTKEQKCQNCQDNENCEWINQPGWFCYNPFKPAAAPPVNDCEHETVVNGTCVKCGLMKDGD